MADLVGQYLPDVTLPCTTLRPVALRKLTGLAVIFIYPWTGRPEHPNPVNWDNLPGAHGSTPQSIAYSSHYDEFLALGVKCFGLSQLDPEWQRDFADRNNLKVPLLSDKAGDFARALGLQYIETGGEFFLKRRTLIAQDQKVIFDRTDVSPPEADADFILAYLNASGLVNLPHSSLATGQRDLIRPVGAPSPSAMEKGQCLRLVPSPTKLEKVDRAKPETDEVPLAATYESPHKREGIPEQSRPNTKRKESNPP